MRIGDWVTTPAPSRPSHRIDDYGRRGFDNGGTSARFNVSACPPSAEIHSVQDASQEPCQLTSLCVNEEVALRPRADWQPTVAESQLRPSHRVDVKVAVGPQSPSKQQ
ncbi:hypothetical protein PR003_g29767 [Phytophthora rubi]|uniref:Uncharacterized protein n=1 Tax=Phytophthora rubi TaxID=129364 RepID=A0A6A3H284_9STRA|nr:hypothetical protein PR002_g29244 [Phytophthora rubi]KAE9273899.1 hypothetical protein PR003_g29767 [Phytophthora rubi]